MGTMLIGGLWHGANWTFVVWGALHGFYLAVERLLKRIYAGYQAGPFALLIFGILTYALVNIAWVFFRATSFSRAWTILGGMFGQNDGKPILTYAQLTLTAIIITSVVTAHALMRRRTLESVVARTHAALIAIIWALMAFAIVITQGGGGAFIYFQF